MRKTLLGQAGKRKRHQDKFDIVEENDSEVDEDLEDAGPSTHAIPQAQAGLQTETQIVVSDPSPSFPAESSQQASQIQVGSALQRNPDGSIVQPKVRPKSKGKQVSSLCLFVA